MTSDNCPKVTNADQTDTDDGIGNVCDLSQLTTTRATCDQFKAGTAPALPQLQYTVNTGKTNVVTIKSVTPSSFTYFVKSPDAGSLSIRQGNDLTFPPGTVTASKVVLYDDNCGSLARTWNGSVTVDPDTQNVILTDVPMGAYVKVPYAVKSVYGREVTTPYPSVKYTFGIEINQEGFPQDTVSLEYKP